MRRQLAPLLLPDEAAEQLGITVAELAEWRQEGRIGCVQVTRSTIRYRPAEVAVLAALLCKDGAE